MDWQSSYSMDTLRERARVFERIRAFFSQRGVLEVDTPLLCQGTITDLHLEAMKVPYQDRIYYLQTSPEFPMKRLLAMGAPSIYQLGKVFRVDEQGRYHNPEFTMLEWYRLDFTLEDLMDEVDTLMHEILGCAPAHRLTYAQAFERYLGVDLFASTADELSARVQNLGLGLSDSLLNADKDTYLQLLFSHGIEPQLMGDRAYFINDFPASQAALAKWNEDGRTAKRCEVYWQGIELANGYEEEMDAAEHRRRFEEDNRLRVLRGLSEKPIDERFLAALEQGLPPCSGIALGVDRLLLCALKKSSLSEVIPFDWQRA